MKISCILTSFNRPTLVQQALKGVADQGYKDYELLIVDDSTIFDVRRLVDRFHFPSVQVTHFGITSAERAAKNRLGVNINHALLQAKGDLVCYLADDDYYFPDWFEKAAEFFSKDKYAHVGFGSLIYSSSSHMDFSQTGTVRFYNHLITNPAGKLDHNQVIHRRRGQTILWPESADSVSNSDGLFFSELAKDHTFFPIHASAAVKRLHSKNLQNHLEELGQGKLDNLRD
jgi:spore maturation protein CgeD